MDLPEHTERQKFEQWYAVNVFDYERDPIGSRLCGLQWDAWRAALSSALPQPDEPLALAIRFHETYERLAPRFGYETRPDTKVFDPDSKNGRLMVAVCAALLKPDSGHQAQRSADTPAPEQGNDSGHLT